MQQLLFVCFCEGKKQIAAYGKLSEAGIVNEGRL